MKKNTLLDRVERALWSPYGDPDILAQLQDPHSEASRVAQATIYVHQHLYELLDEDWLRAGMTEEQLEFEKITEQWRRLNADARVGQGGEG
jgi:hypothetical protein